MSRPPPFSIVLTDDEVALIRSTIWDTDLEGTVRRLLTRATAATGGQRISGTDEEIKHPRTHIFFSSHSHDRSRIPWP